MRAPRLRGFRLGYLTWLLVVISAAALIVPGDAPDGRRDTDRTVPLSRFDVGCAAAIRQDSPLAVVSHTDGGTGNVAVRSGTEQTSQVTLTPPQVEEVVWDPPASLRVEGDAAANFLAARREPAWLRPCAPPITEGWVAGVGTDPRRHGVLQLSNPDANDAIVEIELWGATGPLPAPRLRGVRVPGLETVEVDLATVLPDAGVVTAHVVTSRGRVYLNADDLSDGLGSSEEVRVPHPVTVAQRTVVLTGLGKGPGERVLTVTNPHGVSVQVDFAVVTETSTFTSAKLPALELAPGVTTTLKVSSVVRKFAKQGEVALTLNATAPISAALFIDLPAGQWYAASPERLSGPAGQLLGEGKAELTVVGNGETLTVVVRGADGSELLNTELEATEGAVTRLALPKGAAQVYVSGNGARVSVGGRSWSAVTLTPLVAQAVTPQVVNGGPD